MSAEEDQPEELVSEVGASAWVPAWVLGVGLTPGEFLIYVALRTFADRQGNAHPRPETVAKRASAPGREVAVRSVHNAYGRFRQLGLMTTRRARRDDGSYGPVRVTLRDLPPFATALSGAVDVTTAPDSADQRTTQGEATAPHSAVKEHTTKSNTPMNTTEARSARSPSQRGTRLRPDWEPDEALKEWTRRKISDTSVRPGRELERFRNYWISKAGRDAVKLDWAAVWRNWIDRAIEQSGSLPPSQAGPSEAVRSPAWRPASEIRAEDERRTAEVEAANRLALAELLDAA